MECGPDAAAKGMKMIDRIARYYRSVDPFINHVIYFNLRLVFLR